MKKLWMFLVVGAAVAGVGWGQEQKPGGATTPGSQTGTPPAPAPAVVVPAPSATPPPDDLAELRRELTEGGTSPADFIRVLEAHLVSHPNSPRRADIEAALAKAAMEAKDDPRIIKYGELVLARDPTKLELMERLARTYVMREDAEDARKGLVWAKKFEEGMDKARKDPAPGRMTQGQWSNEIDKGKARALVLESRAYGTLKDNAQAIEDAKKSFEAYPTAEGAREWAKWLAASGDNADAIEHLADAFTMLDARATPEERDKDRRLLGELYTKKNGSEKGLGDVVLEAYDRTSHLESDRQSRLNALDPNMKASSILDFTLPGVNTPDLKLASLKGKTIVLDFWATWCGPCKAQRPLYEQVEKQFASRNDVVFLSVNSDEDRSLTPPFVKAQKWTNAVYYDGGLANYMGVNSIPTTLIVDRTGQISSRMTGFIPERFVDLLTERIDETLK